MDGEREVLEVPRVGRPGAVRPESFRHTLHVVQVADPDHEVLWWAYLDEPERWRVCNVSVGHLLTMHARKILTNVAEWEARDCVGKNPNFAGGEHRPAVPTECLARWAVVFTLDVSEGDPEWALKMLDEGAWEAADYRLEALMRKLARRIEGRAEERATGVPAVVSDDDEAGGGSAGTVEERRGGLRQVERALELIGPVSRPVSVEALPSVGGEDAGAPEEAEWRGTTFEEAILGLIAEAEGERARLCAEIRQARRELEAVKERIVGYITTLEEGVRLMGRSGEGEERAG